MKKAPKAGDRVRFNGSHDAYSDRWYYGKVTRMTPLGLVAVEVDGYPGHETHVRLGGVHSDEE